jgi:very-short-patch-repair endonuclease
MCLHYKKHLKLYARELRKAGNLSEVLLWNELKGNKLGLHFLRQKPVGKYIVDFYCHALSLAVEIDGAATHDGKVEYDERRQKELEAMGVRVVRCRDAEVRRNLNGVVQMIQAEILRQKSLGSCEPLPLKRENMHDV